jgi:Arc/MetJ-type ribon-helix-helix transcriptional regulator
MATMETLQIRLPKRQMRRIDKGIRAGFYRSRSDAIRGDLDRLEALRIFSELQKVFESSGVKKADVLKEAEKVRREIYTQYLSHS